MYVNNDVRLRLCLSYIIISRFVGLAEDPQVLAARAPELFGVRLGPIVIRFIFTVALDDCRTIPRCRARREYLMSESGCFV